MTTYEMERAEREIRSIGRSEDRTYVFVFTGQLESSDTLSAISGNDPNGVALGVTDAAGVLTIGTPAINSGGSITVDGQTVATSKAVTCSVRATNATVGTVYTVTCRARATSGQTLEVVGLLRCE